jgi:hypothetical protein
MEITGGCHCGNIRYVLNRAGDVSEIRIRRCGCTFCTKHGGSWTSHRDWALAAEIRNESLVSKYRFGTRTADFYVCARCGVVPIVVSAIDGRSYAVVNTNTFEGIDLSALASMATNFDGEGTGERLERRKRNWIGTIRIVSRAQ